MSQTCHKAAENAKNESRRLCFRLSLFNAILHNFRKAPQLLLCGIVLRMIIVIQSKNPNHPYIELDFSNRTAVSEMWKILQASSILGNIFETESKFSISYAGCDTDIKIRKRFSAIPSLPFALTSIGPAQLNMLKQILLHLEAIAQADSPNSAPVS